MVGKLISFVFYFTILHILNLMCGPDSDITETSLNLEKFILSLILVYLTN